VHGGEERVPRVRGAGFLAAAALAAGLLLLTSCVLLPVRTAPAVDGLVVDQASGQPVQGALVVVRFDGRYDDVLPDRDLIGHQEARSDTNGRFRMERLVRAGLSAWPHFKTEARVVGVMRAGYRCAKPQAVPESGPVRIELTPALDELDRRESCRPVTGGRGEVTAYMDAWRALFADAGAQAPSESDRQVERLLAARTVLGFGENCTGPVTDLAISPDGARAALRIASPHGDRWQRIELTSGALRAIEAPAAASPDARLAWASASELILVEPDSAPERALTNSALATARTRAIWSAQDAPPAAPDVGNGGRRVRALPKDLSDESERLWRGRSFALARTLDPTSGLPADELRVVREDGSRYSLRLPGETCGQAGHFGRPHYRITADARSGLDLRFVDGGCHAVRIDLESGDWQTLDRASEPAQCESARRVPASNLFVALRGYMREVEATLIAGGADPAAAFVLEIAEDGETHAQARDFTGERRTLRVPRFPLRTPLRRIDVSTVGMARPAAPAPAIASSDSDPL
jgi:hypothetical protein